MDRMYCKLLPSLLLSVFVMNGWAQSETFTATHMWQMKRAAALDVSPDGKQAVFTLTAYDIEKDEGSTDIFLLNIADGDHRQLTFSGKEGSPVFSPDGSKIAFTSRRHDGPAQLFLLNLSGGEAEMITDLPVGVYGLKWFPDGKRIAFAANILPEYDGDFDKLKSMIDEKKESKVTAKVTENVMYRYWDRWLTDGYFSRLFSVDMQTHEVVDLIPGTSNYFNMMGGVSYDISPDGKTIALSFNNTEPPFERMNYDIFLLPTDGSGKLTNITPDNEAGDSNPVFSPDGKKLLYGKQSIYHFYADRVEMMIYDLASGETNSITAEIDLSCSGWRWSPDGKTVFFNAEYKAGNALFSIPSTGGEYTKIFDAGTNSNMRVMDEQTLIFTHHNLNKPADIYTIGSDGKNLRQITHLNDDILSKLNLGKVENVTYAGANDTDVQMFIVYPPDFDETMKYPLVVMIHGGPHGTFGDFWHYRWNAHLFAAPGYVVITPNFHGSTSFGQDFAISIHGDHAPKPFEDIMRATDFMAEKTFIDENRMAAAGGSYGGYMVSWIAGHTDRFAALVNHAGVYDLHLQFASDYAGNRYYQYGGTPWDKPDVMNRNNPSQFANNFKSPMLIIHGELDYRVPVAHAFLVYGIYKGMGLDARLLYYPDENHWILRPQNSIYWYKELHAWFRRYLDY
jgi:dipeptidyl aminopeptidase/acylaminoacyl peptidase